jgi:hypothetical protein
MSGGGDDSKPAAPPPDKNEVKNKEKELIAKIKKLNEL